MNGPTLNTPARLPGLDMLRAVAIFLVLFSHGPAPMPGEMPHWLSEVFIALKRGGWIGVDLFFVLSGFLVSGLLMREYQKHGSLRPFSFLVRRGWKLYPPLAVFLAFVMMQTYVQRGYWPTDRLIVNLLWIQNYTAGLMIHTWSLAVEEHAYFLIALTFGIAAWVGSRSGRGMRLGWIPYAFIPIAIVGLLLRIQAAQASTFNEYHHQFPTHLRIDSLLFGVVIAYGYHEHNAALARIIARYRIHLIVASSALLLPPFIFNMSDTPWIYSYGMMTNYLGAAALLCAILPMRERNGWLARIIGAIGRHSYSIYLWHMTAYGIVIGMITGVYLGKPDWPVPYALHMLVYCSAAIGVGVVMSLLIEVPTLKLRDRLSPRRSGELKPMQVRKNESQSGEKPLAAAPASA
ncbi:MAG: acyltransferase family protein [Phycisphaeraceae bacterium]